MKTTLEPSLVPERKTAPAVTSFVPEVLHLEKILVPTDASPAAEKAQQYAAQLASQFGGEIILLHVIEPFYPYPVIGMTGMPVDLPPDPNLAQKPAAEKALARAAEELRGGRFFKTRSLVRVGKTYDEIVQVARETAADVIVIGTHGYTGVKHFLLGSTAEKVARHAPCPVLIVREKERDFI
jgi:nucleotide-binding universal stress UspA family protein